MSDGIMDTEEAQQANAKAWANTATLIGQPAESQELDDAKKETPSERFRRLAERRLRDALVSIARLETLTGPNYSHTQAQGDYILRRLRDGVSRVEAALAGRSGVQQEIVIPE